MSLSEKVEAARTTLYLEFLDGGSGAELKADWICGAICDLIDAKIELALSKEKEFVEYT